MCGGAGGEGIAGAGLVNLWEDPGLKATEVNPGPDAAHSPDFRSVRWFGQTYTFSPNQAACVKLLWENWESKTPEVGLHCILETAGVVATPPDHVFRGHAAWGTMIVPGEHKKDVPAPATYFG